jgi:hypothetical protein
VAARPDGSLMDPRRVSRDFTVLAKEHGFDFTFHGLRHACLADARIRSRPQSDI